MKKLLIIAALPLLALPSAADAAVFVSRAAFNAAVSGVVNNNLDALPNGAISSLPGIATISSGSFPANAQISPFTGSGNALGGASSATGTVNNFDSVILNFTSPIYAFAFDDMDLTGGNSEFANVVFSFASAPSQTFSFANPNASITPIFFGFTSNTPIQSVRVWSSDTSNGTVGLRANMIDNIAFSSANPVPEPAIWGTMLLGFAIVGSAMRRKQAVLRVRYA
jgi:hypothetical protein